MIDYFIGNIVVVYMLVNNFIIDESKKIYYLQNTIINLFQNKQAQQKLLNKKIRLTNQIIENSISKFLK